MQDTLDFDFNIKDIFLVHKMAFVNDSRMFMYKKGRNMSGFVYCVSGCGEFSFDDRKCYLNAGEFIFLSPESSYTVKRYGEEEFWHITVNFDVDIISVPEGSILEDVLSGIGYENIKI